MIHTRITKTKELGQEKSQRLRKVLLICADFPPIQSGEANHAFYLGLHLARRGIEVHVLTSVIDNVLIHPSITVHPVMRGWSWCDLPRLRAFLKRCAPDALLLIFLGLMYKHHPMMTFAPSIARSVLPSVPFVTQFENLAVHTWEAPLWTRIGRKIMARWVKEAGTNYEYGTLLRDSHHIIVLSDQHRQELAGYRHEIYHKSTLIPAPPIMAMCTEHADSARQSGRSALGITPDEFLFVYYGYLYPGKGLETLFRSWQLVLSRRPHIRLAIVGGELGHLHAKEDRLGSRAYVQRLRNLADELAIADAIRWTGPCPAEDTRASMYFRAADACVLPFDCGILLNNSSLAAAAVHGLPVLTTRGAALEKAFVHQQNVLLCPPKNIDAMAAALETLVGNSELCKRLRTGVRALAQEWFSWDNAVNQTLAAFALHDNCRV